jgi:hypothetical protein
MDRCSDGRMTSRVYVHLDVEDLREALEAAGGCGAPAKPRLVRGQGREEATA